MNKRFFHWAIGILAALSVSVPLAAVDLDIIYLEGSLDYKEGRDTWISVEIGDTVPSDRTIRLSGRGYAELSAGPRRVTLTRDGVYETSGLLGAEPEKANFRQVIGAKFSALLNRSSVSGDMTVAAVRGAGAEKDDFVTWEDDSVDYLLDGKILFEEGDIPGAKRLFEEGSIWESGAIQRECSFRLGLSEQMLGEFRSARNTLTSLTVEPDDPFLGEYTVVMGTLYLESMEYSKADELLARYLEIEPKGEAAQAAWLLSAYSLESQGNADSSRKSLLNAVNLGPETEIGKAAAQMMEELLNKKGLLCPAGVKRARRVLLKTAPFSSLS